MKNLFKEKVVEKKSVLIVDDLKISKGPIKILSPV